MRLADSSITPTAAAKTHADVKLGTRGNSALIQAVMAILLMLIGFAGARTISSCLPVANSAQKEVARASAFDGVNYLVGLTGSPSDSSEACAQFITPAGVLHGSLIHSGGQVAGVPSAPHVAFGGDRYLMAWSDGSDVYGQFIGKDPLVPLIGGVFPIADDVAEAEGRLLDVASDGTDFLVLWSSRGSTELWCRMVYPDAAPGPPQQVKFGPGGEVGDPNVIFGGGQYLAAWMQESVGDFLPVGRLVSATGVPGAELALGAESEGRNPVNVSYGDGRFMVVWHHNTADNGPWDLRGRMVLPDGTLIGASDIPLVTSATNELAMGRCLLHDGDYFLLVWTEGEFGASGGVARGQYFDSDGIHLSDSFVIDDSATGGFKLVVGGSSADGQAMVLVVTDVLEGASGDVCAVFINSVPSARIEQTGPQNSRLHFNGILQSSTDLSPGGWWDVDPQPASPWNVVTGEDVMFFRSRREEDVSASDSAAFVLIPGGSFQMGDDRREGVLEGGQWVEEPVHTVNVSGFFMGKYEVTKALWDEVREWGVSHDYTDLPVGEGTAANHPVQDVNWHAVVKWCNARSEKEGLSPCYQVDGSVYRMGNIDAVVACDWNANGYRLPSEAEWEKAARGGLSGRRFPWGDTISHANANFYNGGGEPYQSGTTGLHPTYQTGFPGTSPVGRFAPNDYGLYDMCGNVREWCWDWWWFYDVTLPEIDPHGPAAGLDRVLRGGGWFSTAANVRCAYRDRYYPLSGFGDVGFRVARGQ